MRRAQLGAAVILAGTIAACTDSAPPAGSVHRESLVAAASPTTTETTTLPEVTTTTEPEPVVTTTEAPTTTEVPYRPPTTRRAPVETTVARAAQEPDYSGEWAIPTYIVMCESGGRWDAYNPSGASGPYQLMPMHFGGELAMNQSRAAQHAKAAELWNGGRGRSHWAACL
jgi:hypothetical protein